MTHEEAMYLAKDLQDQLFDSCNSNSKRPNNKAIILFKDEGWLNLVADALYSAAHPEDQRCPRPINTATDSSMKWCQENGHCGCVAIEELRETYGERVYPLEKNEHE